MQPTRRHVLAGGLVGLGSACTSRPEALPSAVDPDLALIAAAGAREQELLDAYAHLRATHPELSAALAELSSHHEAHLTALGLPPATATPVAVTSAARQPAPAANASVAARTARVQLSSRERKAADAHGAAAVMASRRLAPILASLSACEAAHAAVLQLP